MNYERTAMRYSVWVKFNSTSKIQVNGQDITISLKSKPVRGKANKELVETLADYFGLPSDRIRIISGLNSTKKLVEIEN
jgi:uncharacterized protein YggU (UPF0235/DUF167 family)